MQIRKGSGNGKLILFGEHAAVYGYPALGTPLPCRTHLEWQEDIPNYHREQVLPLTPDEPGKDRITFLALLNRAYSAYPKLVPRGGIWHRTGNVPRIGGFGSSAALCVSLARVILNPETVGYSKDVHRFANFLEGHFHGTPSGVDTGMACDSSPAAWRKPGNGNAVRIPVSLPRWHLIYGALPRRGSTGESVGRLARLFEAGDSTVRTALEELGGIADSFIQGKPEWATAGPGKDAGSAGFARYAAEQANRAQKLLSQLSLSTPGMDQVFYEARKIGALGAKLSGGGMGGAFFICAENPGQRNMLLESLSEKLKSIGIELSLPLHALDIQS